jgi:uncharacterized protein (DUF1330 family)
MMQHVRASKIFAVGLAYAYQEEMQPTGEPRRIFKPKNHPVTPYRVDIVDAIKRSHNKNLSIHGSPGSGKTILTAYLLTQFPEYQRIVFCFKAKDYYLTFTNIRLDVAKYLPDPFANPNAFLGAFETAFSPDNVSLQTEEARNELLRILESVHSWDELKEIVKKGKQSSDSNLRNAYGIIGNAVGVIERYKPHPIRFPRSDVVLDFTGFGDNNKAKVFYAELILRQIYTELVSSEDHKPVIIAIDEAHRLFSNGEKSATILKEIAKEGRQANACLWLSTQNYTEIPSKTISTFGFQFLFKTNEEDDLRAVRAIADFLPYTLTTLPDHMFISLRDHQNLEMYRCQILYYVWNNEKMTIYGSLDIEEIMPTVRKSPLVGLDEYRRVAMELLQRKPLYTFELAKELEKRYGLDLEPTKKLAWDILRKLKNEEGSEVDCIPFDLRNKDLTEGEGKVKARILYYRTGTNVSGRESQLHVWQQNWIAVEYKRAGYKIIDEAKQDERNVRKPDLVVEKTGKQISVEIETGLKHGKIEDLKARIEQSEKENRGTIIIVPNNDVRGTYSAIFPRSLVVCFYPFINSLKGEQAALARPVTVEEGSGVRTGKEENDD